MLSKGVFFSVSGKISSINILHQHHTSFCLYVVFHTQLCSSEIEARKTPNTSRCDSALPPRRHHKVSFHLPRFNASFFKKYGGFFFPTSTSTLKGKFCHFFNVSYWWREPNCWGCIALLLSNQIVTLCLQTSWWVWYEYVKMLFIYKTGVLFHIAFTKRCEDGWWDWQS